MGLLHDSIRTQGKGTHFTCDERLKLESYLKGKGRFPKIIKTKDLAIRLEKSQRTIQREIKRGMVEHIRSDLTHIIEYNSDYAQQAADHEKTAKGPSLKLENDKIFVQAVKKRILEHKYSPYATLQYFKLNKWPSQLRICEKTLYSYIDEGLIDDVSQKDLRYKGKRRKPKKGPHRHKRARCAERSISKRPFPANTRDEFGHWEIDTVVGSQGGAKDCVLTLTERKHRVEIIKSIPSRTTAAVVEAFDQIERKLGSKRFRELFQSLTLTGDCGSEFMDYALLERSIGSKKPRTAVFYAHPYCSSERGSNENANGIIRRFFPKGTDFSLIKKSEVKKVQNWMNNYPRKTLNGLTANILLEQQFGGNFCFP